ncbi:MAG: hypothetical protein DRR08_28065 [Candidatus Parabeggiatoa sp. nov. 2]|nr:MAG: hypothetical protein B6247_26570 [Beggiatoa sp. 4572_84]RKZ52656.1 MAG: hypothetical protein DRR08_28065 [Gammaproteobacteria bacterium]
MQLTRFSVKGFKNFRQEVVLEHKGTICVIHGENNVGKSNVLEAMQLFFQLGGELLTSFEPGLANSIKLTVEELERLGFKASEIFSFGLETPMTLTARLVFEPDETELNTGFELDISIKLQKAHNQIECQILSFNSVDGTEVDKKTFIKFFNRPFALIGVDRLINETELETVRHIVPQTLLLKLYDIKDSPEPSIFEKWELFVSTLQKFNDVLGEGEFVSIFDRHANRANFVFQPQEKRRTPIEVLGSGIKWLSLPDYWLVRPLL